MPHWFPTPRGRNLHYTANGTKSLCGCPAAAFVPDLSHVWKCMTCARIKRRIEETPQRVAAEAERRADREARAAVRQAARKGIPKAAYGYSPRQLQLLKEYLEALNNANA